MDTHRKDMILKRLREELPDTLQAFRALGPDDWETQVYTDGAAWTPKEILAHQLSTEVAIRALVEDVLAGGAGAPEKFDVQTFNETQAARLACVDVETLYAEFAAARAEMIATVERMAPEDFARVGRHPWFGQATLEEVLKLVYRHNMLHVRDVRRATPHPVPPVPAKTRPERD